MPELYEFHVVCIMLLARDIVRIQNITQFYLNDVADRITHAHMSPLSIAIFL